MQWFVAFHDQPIGLDGCVDCACVVRRFVDDPEVFVQLFFWDDVVEFGGNECRIWADDVDSRHGFDVKRATALEAKIKRKYLCLISLPTGL